MIRLEILAKDIQHKLEDISYNLYGQDELGNETNTYPLFNITDDVQVYQNRGMKKDGRKYTPGIIRLVPGGATPVTKWGVYTSMFQLEIYGYRKERHKIKEIFRDFVTQHNGRPYEPEQGHTIIDTDGSGETGIMTTSNLVIDEFNDSNDGLDQDSFVAHIDIVLAVFVGGLSAKETSLKIEGIDMPFDDIQYKQDKSMVANVGFKDSSETPNVENKLIYELLTFNIPLKISDEADTLIAERALNPTYNDLFNIEWDLGIGVKTGNYALRSTYVQYNQSNEAIGVLLSFENTTDVEAILIDGVTIPALEFNFTSVRGTESFNEELQNGNIEVRQVGTTYSYGIAMTLLYDDSIDVLKTLKQDILDNELDTSHTITVGADPTDTYTFDVVLVEGTIQFNERANQTLQVSFAGEKKI